MTNKSGDLHLRSCRCLRYYMEILYGGFRGFSLLQLYIIPQLCRNGDTYENRLCVLQSNSFILAVFPIRAVFPGLFAAAERACQSLPPGCFISKLRCRRQLRRCFTIAAESCKSIHSNCEFFHVFVFRSRTDSRLL